MAGIIEDWPEMKIKSETRKRILKSLMRRAGSLVEKYKLAQSWVKGDGPFAQAVRDWYDLKIKQLSEVSCNTCAHTGCPGQVGMCEGYMRGARKLVLCIGEPK